MSAVPMSGTEMYKASYLPWHNYESIDWKNYATIFHFKKSEIEVYVYKNHLEKRHDCMYAVCPSIRVKEQNKNQIIFQKWNPSFQTNVMQKKWWGFLTPLRMHCIGSHIVFLQEIMRLFQELVCVCVDSFWRSTAPLLKNKYHGGKWD